MVQYKSMLCKIPFISIIFDELNVEHSWKRLNCLVQRLLEDIPGKKIVTATL